LLRRSTPARSSQIDMPAEPDALLDGGYLDQLDAAADPLRDLIIADNA
jgi:hypothetical protein